MSYKYECVCVFAVRKIYVKTFATMSNTDWLHSPRSRHQIRHLGRFAAVFLRCPDSREFS